MSRPSTRFRTLLWLAWALPAFSPASAWGQLLPDRVLFQSTSFGVGNPAVSDNGQAAFLATISPPGQSQLLVGTTAVDRTLRVQQGDLLPGTAGELRFFGTTPPQVNDRGEIAFLASLVPGANGINADNDHGFWLSGPAGIELLAIEGGVAPGAGGAVFDSNSLSNDGLLPLNGGFTLNNRSEVAFTGELLHDAGLGVNSNSDTGIWLFGPDGDLVVAREGDAAPGANGASFGTLGTRPTLNDAGQVAFVGSLRRGFPGVTAANDAGLWMTQSDSQTLQLIAREGEPAPGAGGAVFDFLPNDAGRQVPAINDRGDIAFYGSLQPGAGVTNANRHGVWATGDQGLELVLRSGEPAPGLDGEVLHSFVDVKQNNRGDLLVVGRSVGVDDPSQGRQAIWRSDDDGFQLVAASGLDVPGVPDAEFRQFDNGSFDRSTAINDQGDVMFVGFYQRDGGGFDDGAFAYSAGLDEVVLLATPGSLFAVPTRRSDRVLRIGETANLSDTGEVYINADLQFSGSALFAFQLPIVPEPSGVLLVAFGLAAYSLTRFGIVKE